MYFILLSILSTLSTLSTSGLSVAGCRHHRGAVKPWPLMLFSNVSKSSTCQAMSPSGTSLRETGVETTAGSSGLGLAPSHNRRYKVATSQWKVVPCDLGVVWFHMTVRVRGTKSIISCW